MRLYDHILTVGEIAALVAPPAAPTNLVATIGDASVALSWSASANATSYYLKRSLTSGSGYASVATNTSLTFTNTGLSNGTLYYFVVSAVGPAGEGTNSLAVSATDLVRARHRQCRQRRRPTQLSGRRIIPAGNCNRRRTPSLPALARTGVPSPVRGQTNRSCYR